MSFHRFKEALANGATMQAAADESVVWKKDSSPPDYTALANASEKAAQVMADVAYAQLDFGKQQYEEAKPFLQDIARAQSNAMDQQYEQAKDYYDYNVETFRPLEKGLVADAEAFNTDAYRNELASKAAADAGLAFNQTRQANERAMASMGVNPNSGKYQGLAAQSALGQAGQRSAAMTGTRQQARDLGWAKRMDAAGLGRNLAGASTAAYGSATGAGNAAGANFQSPGAAMQSAYGQYGNTIGSGQQMKLSGLGDVLNAQTKYAMNSQNNNSEFLGTALGVGASFLPSDPRVKENVELVGRNEAIGVNIYEFNYIWDKDTRYSGVMADEVEEVMPEAVHYRDDGMMMVNYEKLGMRMQEVV